MCTICVHLDMCIHRPAFVCGCCMCILVWVPGVLAVTDFRIRKLVKISQRRKQLNSISTTAFKTTREPANGVRNLKCWKNKLEEVLTTWERTPFLEAFLYCMIVKAPLFWALLLLCELKCWILVCAPPMRGKALRKLEEGYMKFSGNVLRVLSQLFNKRQEYGSRCSAETCLEVSRWGVGEYTGLIKCEKITLLLNRHPVGIRFQNYEKETSVMPKPQENMTVCVYSCALQ